MVTRNPDFDSQPMTFAQNVKFKFLKVLAKNRTEEGFSKVMVVKMTGCQQPRHGIKIDYFTVNNRNNT